MKHTYRWILILALLLVALAGCSSSDTTSSTTSAEDTEISDETRLIIGTLKLEGSDQAVTPEQATELLPLWKAYVSLSESDSVAAAELTAVADQIRESMTDEQRAAIDALALSSGSSFELMSELGLASTDGETTGDVPTGGGGGGGSGVPGSGPGASDVTSLSPEQIAELQAERQAAGGGNRSGAVLAAEIVSVLQERAN